MQDKYSNYILGIYGGVGPLASSKFIETIYKMQSRAVQFEQEYSRILLYSDPSMPDRTQYFSQGKKKQILAQLIYGLFKLIEMNVDEIIICCYTLHYLMPDLPPELLKKIISLPCLALQQVCNLKKRSLLLCTSGTIKLRILEQSPFWQEAKEYVIKPDAGDQDLIHKIIFTLKKNQGYENAYELIQIMLEKYQAEAWIVGCTEFHMLSADLQFNNMKNNFGVIIDPLLTIASHLLSKSNVSRLPLEIVE